MHTTCSMANGSKIINLMVTTSAVLVLSFILVHTDARNLGENVNSDIQPEEVFILAGQSNMAGRGALDWLPRFGNKLNPKKVPAEDQPDPKRIFRLNAQLGWEVAKDPLHYDIDPKPSGVGPGMFFANAIKEQVGPTIGLVPCAVGDTNISVWQRGGNLYNNMINRAKVAAQGKGKIKALLWYQGEADSGKLDSVNNYKGKVERFFQDVREDLNSPSLPIIQVAIATGQNDGTENITLIENLRTVQKSINLPNVVTIDAKGLLGNYKPDGVHLLPQSQVTLGRMLAKAYLEHFNSSP